MVRLAPTVDMTLICTFKDKGDERKLMELDHSLLKFSSLQVFKSLKLQFLTQVKIIKNKIDSSRIFRYKKL